MQISVRDLMSTRPVTLSEKNTLGEATALLLERALDSICVCDDEGNLLGSVSDFELLKSRLLNSSDADPIGPLVRRSLITLSPGMLIAEAAPLFRDSCHHRLAVVENGRLVGQLQRREVLRALVVIQKMQSDGRVVRIEEEAHESLPTPALQSQPALRVVTTPDEE